MVVLGSDFTLTLKGTLDKMVTDISEETGQTKQTVVRQILYDYFREGGYKEKDFSDKLKIELAESSLKAEVNRVKFNAMRDKRAVFLPSMVTKFACKVKLNNPNLAWEKMEILLKSYEREAELYGEPYLSETRRRIIEEVRTLKERDDAGSY